MRRIRENWIVTTTRPGSSDRLKPVISRVLVLTINNQLDSSAEFTTDKKPKSKPSDGPCRCSIRYSHCLIKNPAA